MVLHSWEHINTCFQDMLKSIDILSKFYGIPFISTCYIMASGGEMDSVT